MKSEERQYWNIVKGIGILLVVLGHIQPDISSYIYLFHLPLFFFVSGVLYNEKKYGDNPFLNLSNKIKNLWIKYVLIYWGLILFHNIFVELRLLGNNAIMYSKLYIFQKLLEAVFGNGEEIMGGTLWFVPVIVISCSVLGFVVFLSRKVQRITNNKILKYFVQFCFITLCAYIGYTLSYNTIYLTANIQISLIVMPFLWIGHLISVFEIEYEKFLYPILALLCGLILYFVSQFYRLDLALEFVYPGMHVVALLGIYMCLCLAKIMHSLPILNILLEKLGKCSFLIMFAHFPILRIIDWIYTCRINDSDFEKYEIMPVAYPNLFLVYLCLSVGVPLGIYVIYERFFIMSKE